MKSMSTPPLSARTALLLLLAVDVIAFPLLMLLLQAMPMAAIIGCLAIVLIHPFLLRSASGDTASDTRTNDVADAKR